MAYVHTDPPGSLECVPEPDRGSDQEKRTELESSREKFSDERGGLEITEAARSDEASQFDGGTPDASPSAQAKEKHADGKTKVRKGLESIGDLTVDTLQRVASAVGGVAKAPAVVMANVGNPGSNANSPTFSRGTPLVERVGHLEMQMTMLEEKYNSRTLGTKFNLSPHSHDPTTPRSKEKLRTARSLLQETETKGTLVERVQILENRVTEHMESIEKVLSSIQSKLAYIDTGKLKPENLAVQDAAELQESLSGEEFHDAHQESSNLEPLEALDQRSFEEAGVGSDVPGEASGTSPTPQEALVKEPLAAAPTAEPAAEDSADKGSPVLPSSEPQLASSREEPQNALAKEPSAAVPSAKFTESAEDDAAEKSGVALAAAEDSPLTSIVEKPQETLVKEPLAAAPTVEPAEPVKGGNDAGKSVFSSSEPQLASTVEEPQGALPKEPSTAEASAKLEKPAQEDTADKTGTVLVAAESPLTSTVEEPQNGTVGSVTDPEDKHVQKEAEYKSAEDVKVPAGKPEAFASYVMEPKPFGHREKKKKEKNEKRQDGVAEEKDKKNSSKAEEKNKKEKRHDGVAEEERKNSLRAEEKNKQPFKHLRDRFRHAFRSNKDS